jgi:hypothetical protein
MLKEVANALPEFQNSNGKWQGSWMFALSPGERVARVRRFHQSVSRRSRVRGYFRRQANLLCPAKSSLGGADMHVF